MVTFGTSWRSCPLEATLLEATLLEGTLREGTTLLEGTVPEGTLGGFIIIIIVRIFVQANARSRFGPGERLQRPRLGRSPFGPARQGVVLPGAQMQ